VCWPIGVRPASQVNWVAGEYSVGPQPIMLKFLPIVLLSSANKVTHYAQ